MKRLTKNVIALVGSDLTRKFFGFLTIAYLTRHVSISDFGVINIGLTILSYVLIFGAAGIPSFATREIARSTDPLFIGRVLTTRFLLTIILILLASVVILFVIQDRFTTTIFILFTLASIPNAFFLDWYFQGKESMSSIGAARGIAAVVNFLLIFFIVESSADILWVAIAAIAGDVCATFMYFVFVRIQKLSFRFNFNISDSIKLLKQAFPLGLGSILAHSSVNLSPLLLGILLSTHSVGIFSAASKLVILLMMFDRLLATILLPATCRIFSQQPEQFKQRLEETLKWVLLLALPLCIGGTLLSSELIRFVFGEAYAASSPIFSVLVWFLLMTMLHTVYSSALVAIGKEKLFAKVMGLSAVVYVLFILVGTYFYQETGAAIAMVSAELLTVLLSRYSLRKSIEVAFPTNLPQIILALIAMTLSLHFLPEIHFLLRIGIGALVYSLVALFVKAVTITEAQLMFRRVW
ncbi:MAG: flippase [Ignavibacteriae bacterium]|nr:flippase [Ignavibacteriota bacterium]